MRTKEYSRRNEIMIINHNIAALNTYRQLNNNQNISQKSLEKLSSGLRINRAGDDAAGLAISEKMRAQIRGLDQASRNAQDGISMIQTAEGALNEVHSILQRMRELANQAANDTNVGVDRNEIQKEINQLTSEINRIGNTTEFNTQKLLDGGYNVKANATASAEKLAGGTADIIHNITRVGGSLGAEATAATKTASGNYVHGTDISGLAGTDVLKITIDGDEFTVTGDAIAAAKGTGFTDATTFATWLGTNAKNASSKSLNEVAIVDIDSAALRFTTLSENGTASTIQLDISGTNADTLRTFTGITSATDEGSSHKVTGTPAQKAYTDFNFGGVPTSGATLTLYDTGEVIGFYDSSQAEFATLTADEIKAAIGADYIVDTNGLDGAGTLAAVIALDAQIAEFNLSNNGGNLRIEYAAGGLQSGDMAIIGADTSATAASGFFSFTDAPTEGSYITISGQKISFYDSSLENYTNDDQAKAALQSDFAVDIKGLTAKEVVNKVIELNAQINSVADRNVTLSREDRGDGSIRLHVVAEDTGFAGNLIDLSVSKDTTKGFNASFQIGANTAQSMTIEINDMRSLALNISSNTSGGTVKAQNGSEATFTTIKNVSNGTTNIGTEYALDVSTHDKASAAISVINDAIEKVSAERSKLGAFQNRLEHTINNLGTSSENLTAAESRIRDVDMAKEMMEFTKMNILSQAAQAMLAQANQMPQNVLQLLR